MTPDRKRIFLPVAIGAIAVTMTAAGLQWQLSRRPDPEARSGVPSAAPADGAPLVAASRPAAPTLEISAERLAQRLQQQGGSGDDWALLARSYVQLQRYPQAVEAFTRALEKSPGNAAFTAELAAARKAVADGTVAPR